MRIERPTKTEYRGVKALEQIKKQGEVYALVPIGNRSPPNVPVRVVKGDLLAATEAAPSGLYAYRDETEFHGALVVTPEPKED